MNEQPRFWLKVTPAYVVENFEALLRYVAEYNYSDSEPNDSDFNVTVDCLCTVANDLIERATAIPAESADEWSDFKPALAIRIIAAALLSENKRGHDCHEYLLSLIYVLLRSSDAHLKYNNRFINVIRNCALRAKIDKISLHFSDIFPDNFLEATLCARIANIEFLSVDDRCAIYSSLGSVIFKAGSVEVVPMNTDGIEKHHNELSKEITLDCNISVSEYKAKKNISDIETITDFLPILVNEFSSVKPPVKKKLNDYVENDPLDVRITEIQGLRVLCESVDNDYNKISGKIYIDRGAVGITRDMLLSKLRPGNILPAIYKTSEGCQFTLNHEEDDDFIEQYAKDYTGTSQGAIRNGQYLYGSKWLTECGLTVNILDAVLQNNINITEHNHAGAQLKVRIKECKRDAKNNLVCNGDVLPESEQMLDNVDESLFYNNALGNLTQNYIDFFTNGYADVYTTDSDFKYIIAPKSAIHALGLLILKAGKNAYTETTFTRLSNLAVALLLMKIAGREIDSDIARREFDYIKAIADFAMGKSPIALKFNPSVSVETLPQTNEEENIVNILRDYSESRHVLKTSDMLLGEQASLVKELVHANNILIDKIDIAEISRIKKQIVTRLGVADVYRDINHDRTYYGIENSSLEFKISCAVPPKNRQTGSERADIEIQRFNILRTVCAFLNSPSGGDLLIGVNDEGYATGLDNDIDVLNRYNFIAEPTIDRLGVYVKNSIDSAFISNDRNTSGTAITSGCVSVNVEENDEHKHILRVKVIPYPYDVVKIQPRYCPPDQKDVYIRSSATSVSLDKNGIRNLRIRKINALNKNEAKLACILEAIDNRKVIKLKNYSSHNGLTDRKVEPHRIMSDQSALQAFDHSSRQMRLFKLSRISEIEPTDEKWKYASKHRSLRVDIFGMMESDNLPPETITLKMTDFALMLLKEEHPVESVEPDLVKIVRNTGVDSKTFPWIVSLTTFHPAGYTRFVRGLPEQIQQISDINCVTLR